MVLPGLLDNLGSFVPVDKASHMLKTRVNVGKNADSTVCCGLLQSFVSVL